MTSDHQVLLETQNLVTRTLCNSDRRGVFVVLTDEGVQRLAEARPTHRVVLAAELTAAPAVGDGTVDASNAAGVGAVLVESGMHGT